MNAITDRIERELGIHGLAELLAERLDPTDLQSLLLDVYRRLAARRPTSALLGEYTSNRFVTPTKIAPTQLLEWDRVAAASLPEECELIELSPVCPLGVSAAMSGLTQDRVLSTIRNTEVVSDSTNVLALEAAVRRRALKRDMPRSSQAVHLAASHRLLRMQRYDDPRLASHFKIFSLCSAGRDRGSFLFEMEALGLQMTFYLRAIRAFLGDAIPLRVTLTALQSGATMSAAANDLSRRIREQVAGVPVDFDPERTVGREYYRTMCFWIHATPGEGKETQLVDGGCVDWTQRLLGDAKERLVVSGVGSDRVCTLRGEAG
jgi:hypothetical protein